MSALCLHCDQQVVNAFYDEETHGPKVGPFCCQGCLTVHHIISLKGLSQYYEIKRDTAFFKKKAPAQTRSVRYSYLDEADFLQEYSYIGLSQKPTMEFYLEGIHCLACLWIIEKLPDFTPGIESSKLHLGRSVVTVSLFPGGKFSDAARELESIGYHPHPLKMNQSTNELKIKQERSMLLRIGIAGAAAGNIMLYAISIYAGAGPRYEFIFNAMTAVFAIPVFLYSAQPFYKNSYIALKNKTLSIDVPISLALIMGAVMGFYNLAVGIHENYFDSLTALVFLLLLSRYFLKNIQERGLSTNDLNFFYQGESLQKQDEDNPGVFTEIHPKTMKVNDLIKVSPNQMIPADGLVVKGETYLNTSLLTGESRLHKAFPGDEVFSGTMNASHDIIIKVQKINDESRLGKILRQVENGWGQKARIVDVTNKASKYFVAVVFLLSFILFIYQSRHGNYRHALETALTLLIVTCPCALAIATPLTFIRTLSKSAQKGIIIKDDQVVEKLSKAKNIFIDKTGTLTLNNLKLTSIDATAFAKHRLCDIIYSLEMNSLHPVGKCLREWAQASAAKALSTSDLMEIPGVGVSARINGILYEVRNYQVYEDQKMIAQFTVKDSLRADSKSSVQNLKEQGLNLRVLSGDKKEFVGEMARELGLTESECLAELSPEEKNTIIKRESHTVMIGDGANDSIALSSADTGIAVFGAMDISLRAADVYLTYPGLSAVSELMVISKETMKVVYRNLVLSLLYNVTSVALAFTGHISPLAAAIIMPLSSLSVLISTLIGTKELRSQWK